MQGSNNIILIGPMGSGKTTIGKQVAEQLGLDLFDSDSYIEQKSGADIPWIFDIEGEDGFRVREIKAINELCQHENIVLSTGGGSIVKAENRKLLQQSGWCVFINLDIEEQWRRLEKVKNRPLIRAEGKNVREKLEQTNAERLELYLSIADFEVHSSRASVTTIVDTICENYFLQKVSK